MATIDLSAADCDRTAIAHWRHLLSSLSFPVRTFAGTWLSLSDRGDILISRPKRQEGLVEGGWWELNGRKGAKVWENAIHLNAASYFIIIRAGRRSLCAASRRKPDARFRTWVTNLGESESSEVAGHSDPRSGCGRIPLAPLDLCTAPVYEKLN
ncbi:hypothetical protein L596_015180 [Steinernema carpocapsae]|uniref:Uncharacterized protein n=1 Tax=Steinernema carpocapsae TaxID=34508 RepID=A0A4U5NF42_STECR|nr:hypothetical protein L596_015180 [Steinernema carpocapsae]